ncbi:amino acid adenylation domain-containing protein [Amycolatopsis rhizosphaerae]|uniref:Amino acid adenylation domain-containing protein n=1 Tax=Amycolatopsis rhizosphaerae TaxID=2053003 RepID=A0A558CYK7_9PSEU|nr:non-ribosomal peptide synthetase [Amycolatopsis rhizosphaerae]TVT53852.1 amino acid adenylation domain-containing protein [Amycolatopsis rhizosphaerae]
MTSVHDDVYLLPVSHAQRRMWFLDQLDPGGRAYVLAMVVRLRGPLSEPALRRAVNAVVARHETLRTTFADAEGDGEPWQVVAPELELEVPTVDVSTAGDPVARAAELAEEAAAEPFDLARGPLLRVRLFRLAAEDHVLVTGMHHIVTDGWSLGVFARELGLHYQAALRGEVARLPELPVQYADYAVWQREQEGSGQLEQELGHWRRQLEGAPPVADLPIDRPRATATGSRGAKVPFHWPPGLRDRLLAFGGERGATLFMVLLAGFTATLARYGGGDDIVVGTPVAGRSRPELEGLIGLFVNTLALRTRLHGDPDFESVLSRVRETCLDAYSHQELPFERLVEALEPERSLARNPVVQTFFVLQNTPGSGTEWPGLEMVPLARETGDTPAKFDLSVIAADGPGGIDGVWEYDSDLFERETVERMAGHLRRLLEAALDEPARPVGDLPLLSAAERRLVLEEWNSTPAPASVGAGVHRLFTEQVARTPGATALVEAGERLTYRELDAKANRLAHRLRAGGVGPEDRVALLQRRSADFVVSLMAVLKAGAAYVPLDARAPDSRLRAIVAMTGAKALLTDTASAGRIAHEGRIVVDAPSATAGFPDTDPAVAVHPDQLAYVMYTSGSTGIPKGVAVTHRDVAQLALDSCWHGGNHRRVLLHSPGAFDASTYELWVPLLAGGELVVAPDGDPDVDGLARLIAGNGITGLWLTAGLFRVLADEHPGCFAAVREVWAGGDVVPPEAVARVLAECPGLVVVDGYGPTETTTFATRHRMRADGVPVGTVPIGRPLDGLRAYVLDERLRPVPPGVRGELYLAGAGLARGYLDRPALTAERFVADPFGPPGERAYRTGDLVRWTVRGELEFLGRADDQVKVRGFRVEPGEVEAVLRARDDVREIVVVAAEDGGLTAYVVPASAEPGLAVTLRAHCAAELPDYLIPARFVTLEALPLTPNGKVDRRALPEPGAGESGAEVEYVAPRNAVESVIAGVWEDVLGVPKVGAHDSFFALGGHSLLAARLATRLRTTFGVDLALGAVFAAPTVAGLAEALVAAEPEPGHVAAVAELRTQIDSLSPEEILAQLDEEADDAGTV